MAEADDILREAAELINGSRASAYGRGPASFPKIAAMWQAAFGWDVQGPEDVALAMIMVKIARLSYDPSRTDSWIDIAGYAALGGGKDGGDS